MNCFGELLAGLLSAAQEEVAPLKPASQEADWRSVASMVALRSLSATDFAACSALWCGACLQQGCLFQQQGQDGLPGKVYLSLGFHFAAVILWQVTEVQRDLFQVAPRDLSRAGSAELVNLVCATHISKSGNGEEFAGVPFEICDLHEQAYVHNTSLRNQWLRSSMSTIKCFVDRLFCHSFFPLRFVNAISQVFQQNTRSKTAGCY